MKANHWKQVLFVILLSAIPIVAFAFGGFSPFEGGGSASYPDQSGASGKYLKSSGTAGGESWDSPTAAGNETQINRLSTAVKALSTAPMNGTVGATTPSTGAFTTFSAGSGAMTVDADGDVTAKSYSTTRGDWAQETLLYEATSDGDAYFAVRPPAKGTGLTANQRWVVPTAPGVAGEVLKVSSLSGDNATLDWVPITEKLAVFGWDGGGAAITADTGDNETMRCALIPYAATVVGAYVVGSVSTTSTAHIWRANGALPSSGGALGDITLTAATYIKDTTLTGFDATDKTWAADDVVCAVLHANNNAKWLNLTIYGTRN